MAAPVGVTGDSENSPHRSAPAVDQGACESCGRFVGPYERCPYCGARTARRLSIRIIKLAAGLLATLGLAGLWGFARIQGIPEVTAGEATGMMNMAYVQISGHVTRNLSYDPDSGYLAFWLGDESGEIYVSAYRDVTEELVAQDKVPALGDEVSAAGTLRIRDDMVSLTVNVPEHLTFRRPSFDPLKIGEISQLDAGRRVRIAGKVNEARVPYAGLTIIAVEDESGKIDIAVNQAVTDLTGSLPEIAAGQGITVEGCVSLYKATPQIVPASVADIQLAAAPPPLETVAVATLAELAGHPLGETVHVQARVILLEGLNGGVKATLDDGTAQVTLLLWDRVYEGLEPPTSFDVGAEVAASGSLQVYEDDLEIIPATAGDVTILSPADPPPWVEAGKLTAKDAGRVVRVRGILGRPEGFSAGVKAELDDGTGTITVLLWSNLYEAITPRPQQDQVVEAAGLLDVFQGRLELIPRSHYDWRVRPPDD